MTVHCIDCQHFSLRNAGSMAKRGYGHCEFAKRTSQFESATFPRQCSKFEKADADTSDKRRAWLRWEQKRFMQEVTGK